MNLKPCMGSVNSLNRSEQVMKPINVEILMGHSIGISDSYYRPQEKEIL